MDVLLVVKDGALERQLRDFFTRRGRGVTASAGSAAARAELRRRRFAYLLVDLEVDDEAADLCRAAREQPGGEMTLCLVLPASETVADMRDALAAGADDYLLKPVDSTALQLRLALGERHLAVRQKQPTPAQDPQDALIQREQYFRSLLENSSDLITIIDDSGHILYQTASSERLLGWKANEMMGWNVIEHVHPDDRERLNATLKKAIDEPESTPSAQCRLRRRAGEYRSFESLFKNLLGDEVVEGVVMTSRDISEHRRLESELKREQVFFQQLFGNSPTGIVILDPEERIVNANDAFLDLFQLDLGEIKRRSINECIVPDELRDEAEKLTETILQKETVVLETTRRRADGSVVEVAVISYPIEVSGRMIGSFAIYSDITQRKEAERTLYHHAYHDALTGLPNRALMTERLERALRRAKNQEGFNFAVLFIDLDRFKIINDSLGHEAGDELLIEMARRLETCVRPGDTTARLGGDEFTIILEDMQSAEDATIVADRILASLAEPFHIAGQEIGNSGSIGIAYGSERYEGADALLRDADLAMYRAKSAGKARYAIFDAEMHETAMRRLQLETALRRAIENDEMVLYYQPMVSLTTRRVVGFEALVRWARPNGVVVARELIPVCEETGLILPLGNWVLRQAMRQAVDWQNRFPDADFLLTVNVSAKETSNGDFLKELDLVQKETGIKPASIGFEMNESLVVGDDEAVKTLLWELKGRGYRIYIDSFGTGQSSLNTLYRFPIDVLKIDRSFIAQLATGAQSQEIIAAIAALGESLGMSVIAGGIETREQLAQIRQLDLTVAQGFLFARPLPRESAEKLLSAGPLWQDEGVQNPAQ